MSIQVRSSDAYEAEAKPQVNQDSQDQSTSAPKAQEALEQKDSAESDTADTEEVEADQDLDVESDDDETAIKDDEAKPRKKGGFQRRIDKLNARVSEREKEVEYWRALALQKKEAGENSAQSQKVDNAQTQMQASQDGKPNPDTFDTHAEYVEALTDWKLEQRELQARQKAEREKLETEQRNLLKSHSERVKSFSEKTEDFHEALEAVDDIPVSAAVQEIILQSDHGPELMYELAKNRDEYARICALSPLSAARELGKIESKIASRTSDERKPEPNKITKAPKPIEPVGRNAKGVVTKSIDDPNLPQAEYERLRREQQRRKQD